MNDNSEQIKYWNGQAGETWVQVQQVIDQNLAPLSELAIAAADPRPGERVIDVGCGCGTTSLALAARGAAVWGIDISGPMLAHARTRVTDPVNVAFSRTDAATQNYTPDHHLVFSRFGVMFFSDPLSAFTNLRTALTDNGRMVFICWQKPGNNPWMSVAGAAIQPFLPPPTTPPDPRAPGPFAFADKDYLSSIMTGAGFSDLQIDSVTADIYLGRTVDDAMESQSRIGPLSRALGELGGEAREQALSAARAALAKHTTDRGLSLGAAVWLVQARR